MGLVQGVGQAVLAGLSFAGQQIAGEDDSATAQEIIRAGIDRLTGAPPPLPPGFPSGRAAGDIGRPRRVDVNRLFGHVRTTLEGSLVQIQHETLDAPFVAAAEELLHKAALQKWGKARFRESIEALADRYGATTFTGSMADTWYNTTVLNASYNRAALTAYGTGPAARLFPYLAFRDAGDDVVRPTHHALNGFVARSDWAGWEALTPPLGWNCRCRLVPVSATIANALGWEGEYPRGREFLMPRTGEDGEFIMPGPDMEFRAPLVPLDSFFSQ